MGLQARTLFERLDPSALSGLFLATALVTAVAIAARFIWVFPATYLPRWLSPSLAKRDPSPPWQWTFFLAFAGVRGVVSLTAALGLPFSTSGGAPFPGRDLILFVTFGIIIITLIGQGIVLPVVVRWLSLDRDSAKEHQREMRAEHLARKEALDAARQRLENLANEHRLPEEVLASLQTRHEYRAGRLRKVESEDGAIPVAAASWDARSLLIDAERRSIFGLLQAGKITDESRRRLERELDLEEATVDCRKQGGIEPPL